MKKNIKSTANLTIPNTSAYLYAKTIIVALLTLLIAACGSDDPKPPNPTPTPNPDTKTFTVTFNLNAADAQGKPDTENVEEGKTVQRPTSPTRDGYSFKGWFTDEASQNAFDFATPITANTDLYAGWEEIPVGSFLVRFVTGQGATSVDDVTVREGETTKQPSDPTRALYLFAGWFTDNNTFQNEFDFNTPITANLTLYAKWESNSFKVTFNTNGAGQSIIQTVEKGQKATAPSTTLTRNDDIFDGWFTDNGAFQNKFDFDNTIIDADLILYAKWISVFDVSFITGTGGSRVSPQKLQGGEKATKPQDPTRVAYTFEGWFTDNRTFQSPFDFDTPINSDVILYAKWARSTDKFYIPDDNFRNYLKGQIPNAFDDKDSLKIGESEVTGRQNLDLFSQSIADLTGIEYFLGLQSLSCGNNQLVSLDVSQNSALTNLDCSANKLIELDVSQNAELNDLKCQGNELTKLVVSKELVNLACHKNSLTSLVLPENSILRTLTCQDNQLTSLDVSKSTRFLQSLDCSSNQLTSLNLSQNTSLTQLYCQKNTQMKELDMTGMRSLGGGTSLIINDPLGSENNPYERIRVHEKLKNNDPIKRVKVSLKSNVTISTFSAADGSVDYKEVCGDYDPVQDSCSTGGN